MLDDEIELGEIGGGVIDVVNIEGVGTQRVHCRPLVHVYILDARFLGQLQILIRPWVVQAPSA